MVLQTVVDTQSDGFALKHNDKVLLLGSCFAEKMGERLQNYVFNAQCNPFGVLYNPASIANALHILTECYEKGIDNMDFPLFQADGLWRSWSFGTCFASIDKDEALSQMRQSIAAAIDKKWPPDVLIITFGTNRAYLDINAKCTDAVWERVVANCHKQPERTFDVWDMSIGEIVDRMKVELDSLLQLNQDMRVVFTVSPYRYAKYGFHHNQLSKSILLLAVDALRNLYGHERIFYFPAYELLMDEMRDYRFYAEDMLHPSQTAVDIIWERFAKDWISDDDRMFINEWDKCLRMMAHRPLHPDSEDYRRFSMKLTQTIEDLQKRYPELPISGFSEAYKNSIR